MLCFSSLSLKVFDDPNDSQKKWKASVKDIEGDVLCVSQFTLMASTAKNKPDFHRAMASISHSFTALSITHLQKI